MADTPHETVGDLIANVPNPPQGITLSYPALKAIQAERNRIAALFSAQADSLETQARQFGAGVEPGDDDPDGFRDHAIERLRAQATQYRGIAISLRATGLIS